MPRLAAVPFTLRRQNDVVGRGEITATTETVHGLLHLDGEQLIIQWRVHRTTNRIGEEIRTDQQVDAVREATIPVAKLAGAILRSPWWAIGRVWQLVLTAADLRAFESFAGPAGLRLIHPAQLVLQLRRHDRDAGREFAADVELAISEQALRLAAGAPDSAPPRFPPSGRQEPPPDESSTGAA